jgi:hypothetical protein
MIVHTISKTITTFDKPNVYTRSKQWFNAFLNSLSLRTGDYVTYRNCPYPYVEADIWRIRDIQEVRHLVEWDAFGDPKAIQIVNSKGEMRWVTKDSLSRVHHSKVEIKL